MCSKEYADWQRFLEVARKRLKDVPMSSFKASDAPVLYALYARRDYDAERLLSKEAVQDVLHRVFGSDG